MATTAMFPHARNRSGMYESFYMRAVAPEEPVGVWIRHTVQKPAAEQPRGSVWCTVFDASRGRPFMHKLTSERLRAPEGGWIEVGEPAGADRQGASMSSAHIDGACGAAAWSLRWESREPELRHLPREWLYWTPLPRTKLTSPAPAASFDGSLRLAGDRQLELHGWRGMVGHNWGAEHAERWIWLHGIGFAGAPDAWLDVALGRLKIAGRLTPWVANGALCIDGRRISLGGLGARGLEVEEGPEGCSLRLPGEDGLLVQARVRVPTETAAGWHYGDPDGGGHDVVNCSIAELELTAKQAGEPVRSLHSAHGAVYELGMRERDHGVPIAPFSDGR